MSKNYVQIDPKDNIIVAITPLEKGLVTQVAGKQVVLKETIKQKHKYSLNDFLSPHEARFARVDMFIHACLRIIHVIALLCLLEYFMYFA